MTLAPRPIGAVVALAATVLLGAAVFLEHALGLEPCPLCMMQRIWVGLTGAIGLALAAHGPRAGGARLYGVGMVATAIIGSVFSLRQLWLQSLPPDQVPACGPGLEYMIDVLPWTAVLRAMTWGGGSCAEVTWRWLGLSIPAWVLLAFLAFALAGVMTVTRARGGRAD